MIDVVHSRCPEEVRERSPAPERPGALRSQGRPAAHRPAAVGDRDRGAAGRELSASSCGCCCAIRTRSRGEPRPAAAGARPPAAAPPAAMPRHARAAPRRAPPHARARPARQSPARTAHAASSLALEPPRRHRRQRNPDDYAPATGPGTPLRSASHVRRGTADGVPLYQDAAATPGTQHPAAAARSARVRGCARRIASS